MPNESNPVNTDVNSLLQVPVDTFPVDTVNSVNVRTVNVDFLKSSQLNAQTQGVFTNTKSTNDSMHNISTSSHSRVTPNVSNDNHSIVTGNNMFVAEEVVQGYNGSLFNIITETSVKCIYTNADQLRNKMNELDILITQENPDFIFVTEVLPKSTTEVSCSSVLFSIDGYDSFPSKDGGRGVMMYARSG